MIVCKFGGSATARKEGIENIKKISQNGARKVLVFSAVGKNNEKDVKLTDLLINYTNEDNLTKKEFFLEKINKKLQNLIKLLKISFNIEPFFSQIKSSNNNAYIISRGEYITSLLLANYLNIKFLAPEEIIFFKNKKFDSRKTKRRLLLNYQKYGRFVTGGFYGYDSETDSIVLFERGGGDTTGAIISKLLGASVYENYTDVSGVKPINPKHFYKTKTISKISYNDMKKLSSYDASVLHKSVCEILSKSSVITKVMNIFDIDGKRTIIDNQTHCCNFVCFKETDKKIDVLLHGEKEMKLSIKKSP